MLAFDDWLITTIRNKVPARGQGTAVEVLAAQLRLKSQWCQGNLILGIKSSLHCLPGVIINAKDIGGDFEGRDGPSAFHILSDGLPSILQLAFLILVKIISFSS